MKSLVEPSYDQLLFTYIIIGSFTIGWWIPNALLGIIYKYNLLNNLKIQPNEKFPPSDIIWETIIHNIIQSLIIQPILAYGFMYKVFEGVISVDYPGLGAALFQFLVCFVFADGLFYWLHRLFHHPLLYKRFHKQHHRYRSTIGIAANFASPMEETIVGFGSTMAGPLLLTYFNYLHWSSLFIYLVLRYEESVEEHSGIDLWFSAWKLLRDNAHHDYHHSHNKGAYGTFPFWDRICGTDDSYLKYIAAKKDKVQ